MGSGQVFRWQLSESGRWLGADGDAWFAVRVDAGPEEVLYSVESNADRAAFERFFRLSTRLSDVEASVVAKGPELAPYIAQMPGLRVLAPSSAEEVLFSFLCTPNNNIERITRMVRALADYGEPIGTADDFSFRKFPSAERIAAIPEAELRAKGFGYRGATIPAVARQILERREGWLEGLKSAPYQEAHAALCSLKGIGPKLADCICLIGLGHLEAVPVDTHLWQAAVRLYFPELGGKALTQSRYDAIGNHFRFRFGSLAGWAHQYLFYENLLGYRSRRKP